jgi:lipoprotein-releasing system permease protein
MAFSIATLIAASAIIRGFKSEISKKIFDFWGHIHITSANIYESFESEPIELDDQLIKDLSELREFTPEFINDQGQVEKGDLMNIRINRVTPFITLPILMETKSEMEGLFLKAVHLDRQWLLENESYIKLGSFSSLDTAQSGIVLSETTASRIKAELGDWLLVHWIRQNRQKSKRLKVVGIYNTGLIEYDKAFAFSSMDLLRDLQDWNEDQITGYEIGIDEAEKAEALNNYIFYEKLPLDWFSVSVTNRFRNIFQWLRLQSKNETVLIGLLSIVVLINLATVFLILLINRVRVIGVLKALGAPNQDIRMIFIYIAAGIVFRALIFGNVIGIAFCLLQKYFHIIKLREEDYYLSYAPVELNLSYLISFNILAMTLTILFMFIPALLISRFNPMKIIRFD